MASLCSACKEAFGLPEEKLQEFLQALVKENKGTGFLDQSEASCSEAIKEDFSSDDSNSDNQAEHSEDVEDVEPLSKRCKLSPGPFPSGLHDQVCCCPKVSCVACLGLLEEPYIQHLTSTIIKCVKQCRMDGIETYNLSINVPLSLLIRKIGMERAVKKCNPKSGSKTKFPNSESNYVKERLKWKIRRVLDSALLPLICDYSSPLMINLSLDHRSSLRDCINLKKLHPEVFQRPKKRKKFKPLPISGTTVQKALNKVTEADMVKVGYFLTPISTACTHTVELQHRSVFVAGRYNKYSRKLPQTPWVVDGVKKSETSVQELISSPIMEAFRAADVRFSSLGFEEADARMLGNGRPFLLELLNPMNVTISNVQLQRIEAEINTTCVAITVQQLRKVSRDNTAFLRREQQKGKTYSALIWTEGDITNVLKFLDRSRNLLVRQKTPIRELHRRGQSVRETVIYSMESELLDAHHFRLKLVARVDLWIKEFVHGDFGRTQPNIGTLLGCNADILSLDVLDVHLINWPP